MPEIKKLIVGVRFIKGGKIYHFDATEIPDLKIGDSVVVETSRGWQLGDVAQILPYPEQEIEGGWKSIDRRATPRDLLMRQSWQKKEESVVEKARQKVNELGITGVKVVAAEYSFDGAHLTLLYNNETEEKIDLKSLKRILQKSYSPSQVEFRQIGPRDVAKIIEGIGACGLEKRCCSKFLMEFSSISIRMAKNQGVSLTPSEITGMCGRLRCCLQYENELYAEARKRLPKRNKRVTTPSGEGKVLNVNPLIDTVLVEIPEVGRKEFPFSEISTKDESAQPPKDRKN